MRSMWRRVVKIPVVVATCLLAVSCYVTAAQEPYDPRAATALDAVPDSTPVPEASILAAWAEVRARMGHNAPPPRILPPAEIVRRTVPFVDEEAGHRYYGIYYLTHELDATGLMVVHEKIVIFLEPEQECLLHELLVHELLHSVHARLAHIRPEYGAIDGEVFVAAFLPQRPDFPACSESN